MVRVTYVEKSLDFYCSKLGLKEIRRKESDKGRFTLIFLGLISTGLGFLFWNIGLLRVSNE